MSRQIEKLSKNNPLLLQAALVLVRAAARSGGGQSRRSGRSRRRLVQLRLKLQAARPLLHILLLPRIPAVPEISDRDIRRPIRVAIIQRARSPLVARPVEEGDEFVLRTPEFRRSRLRCHCR